MKLLVMQFSPSSGHFIVTCVALILPSGPSSRTLSVYYRYLLGLCTVWPHPTKSKKKSIIDTAVETSQKTVFLDHTHSVYVPLLTSPTKFRTHAEPQAKF
jgi:hypothetical protein